jgi:hypothetical protein
LPRECDGGLFHGDCRGISVSDVFYHNLNRDGGELTVNTAQPEFSRYGGAS